MFSFFCCPFANFDIPFPPTLAGTHE